MIQLSSDLLSGIRGLLIDLDGVLYIGERPVEGAIEAVRRLKDMGLPCRYTTNTTTRSLAALHEKLSGMGFPVEPSEVYGVIRAAQHYLRHRGSPSCHLLLTDGPASDFAEFPRSENNPDVVVIGDVGKYWDYSLINRVFRMVMSGAEMVALHKGKYWQTESGLQVDMGAFVAGLEYVTGKQATVIGKPSGEFFGGALEELKLRPGQVAMIGDDIASDIGGAQNMGMRGVLVRTGKYREETVALSDVTPDLIVDSIADVPGLLAGR